MVVFRRIALGIVLLATIMALISGLIAASHWRLVRDVTVIRVMAVSYMLCDVVICSSLILLLIMHDRRAPAWLERRLPFLARWLWHVLLGLAILSYAGLAPTFLFLILHLKR